MTNKLNSEWSNIDIHNSTASMIEFPLQNSCHQTYNNSWYDYLRRVNFVKCEFGQIYPGTSERIIFGRISCERVENNNESELTVKNRVSAKEMIEMSHDKSRSSAWDNMNDLVKSVYCNLNQYVFNKCVAISENPSEVYVGIWLEPMVWGDLCGWAELQFWHTSQEGIENGSTVV